MDNIKPIRQYVFERGMRVKRVYHEKTYDGVISDVNDGEMYPIKVLWNKDCPAHKWYSSEGYEFVDDITQKDEKKRIHPKRLPFPWESIQCEVTLCHECPEQKECVVTGVHEEDNNPSANVTHSEKKIQGDHYKDEIECIDVLELLESTGAGFHEIQAVRYIWRAGRKTGESKEKDLKKALNYLHRKLEGKWFYE